MQLNDDALNAELARRSLLSFAQRMISDYEVPPHIRLLASLLEELERPNSGLNRLCISLPPRFGKSTLCSQLFAAWAIGRNARRSVILASHSSELANGFSRHAKGYIESDLWPFPKITMSEDSRSVHRWHVTGGGGLVAAGIPNSGLTGVGCDFGICDDPVNSGLSQAERDAAWAWFQQVFFPRQNANAKLLVVSARLATDDIPGRLMQAEDSDLWRFVALPAINEVANELNLEPGKPLWDRFDERALNERRAAMGFGAYSSQYLQDPTVSAGGKIFRIGDFPLYETLPKTEQPWDPACLFIEDALAAARPAESAFIKCSAIDAAGTENTSSGGSYTAVVSTLTNLTTGETYIIGCERIRGCDFNDLREFVVKALSRIDPDIVILENAAAGGRLLGDLSRSTSWPMRGVTPKTSKVERALQVIGQIESGKVFIQARAPWRDMLTEELAAFSENCRYSDMVDSLVYCLLYARQAIAAKRVDSYYDRHFDRFSLFGR